jgi:hypothetical protein
MKVGSKYLTLCASSKDTDTDIEPISKRVPVRLRNKIQKKSAAKQRKNRKIEKNVRQPRRQE